MGALEMNTRRARRASHEPIRLGSSSHRPAVSRGDTETYTFDVAIWGCLGMCWGCLNLAIQFGTVSMTGSPAELHTVSTRPTSDRCRARPGFPNSKGELACCLRCAVSINVSPARRPTSPENFAFSQRRLLSRWLLFTPQACDNTIYIAHPYDCPSEVTIPRPGRPNYLQGCLAPAGTARQIRYVVIAVFRFPLMPRREHWSHG